MSARLALKTEGHAACSVYAVVWAMPLLNFKGFRDAYMASDGALDR